jgi:hypothetical protein
MTMVTPGHDWRWSIVLRPLIGDELAAARLERLARDGGRGRRRVHRRRARRRGWRLALGTRLVSAGHRLIDTA